MMPAQIDNKPLKWRKTLMSSVIGAAIGFFATIGLARLYQSGALGEFGLSEFAAALTALVFLLMGLIVGIGVAMPGAGARFLNFEDEEELNEQRRALALTAPAAIALALALGALAMAGPRGIVAPGVALGIVLALWTVATVLTALMWREMDELARGVTVECGNLSYYLVFLVGGFWALLGYLGFMPGPAPLDWLTMLHALPLLAAFIAAGRRGMLAQR